MSAIIKNFIIHQLYLKDDTLGVKARDDIFEVNHDIQMFGQQLNQTFNNKPVRGIAGFSNDNEQEGADFQSLLSAFLEGESEFIPFSVDVTKRLISTLIEVGTPETGFLIISHYQFLATDYLLIALLGTQDHIEVTPQLDVSLAQHVDLAKMQLAARIDLTMLQTQPESNRYISFIKGRAGRKIADFFLQFLGCEEQVDVRQQNKLLVEQVEQYMTSEQLQPEEKQAQRGKLVDYYKEKVETGDEVQLQEVAETLAMSDQTQDFVSFSQQMETPVEESFQADRNAIKTLNKFSGQGGGVTISFDRKLLGERVVYQAESDTLLIKGLPPNLKDQLTRFRD